MIEMLRCIKRKRIQLWDWLKWETGRELERAYQKRVSVGFREHKLNGDNHYKTTVVTTTKQESTCTEIKRQTSTSSSTEFFRPFNILIGSKAKKMSKGKEVYKVNLLLITHKEIKSNKEYYFFSFFPFPQQNPIIKHGYRAKGRKLHFILGSSKRYSAWAS